MADTLVQPLYKLLLSNPQVLFTTIMLFFRLTISSVSVEILPSGWTSSTANPHEPFEFTENNLGIPKNIFYGIYVAAIKRFDALLATDRATVDKDELQLVTGIVLLGNPGHFTALNRRKELVRRGFLSEEDELRVTAAWQLRSEGAKSSILWHHRRWLLRRRYSPSAVEEGTIDTLDGCSLPVQVFSNELAVATSASEIYPRNYHSWLHRMKCLTAISQGSEDPNIPEAYAQILRAEEFMIKRWIESHVSDYTAMQYMCRLYAAMETHAIQHIQTHADPGELLGEEKTDIDSKSAFSPLSHAIELVRRYPTHEALWYYLRSAYASQVALGTVRQNMQELQGINEEYWKNFERWKVGFSH
ncbi:hypothetical protein FRC17_000854 [Serendipita sp. 399]|nr:hypothetical protein FRC17_000854 [Serendipita sp. 399]